MSLDDPKVWGESFDVTPMDVDVIDTREGRPFVGPLDEICEGLFRSFRNDLDVAIGAILDPTKHAQTSRFVLCRRSKRNALHVPANHQVHLLLSHRSADSLAHDVEAFAKVQFRAFRSAQAR
jgi:hypothetical protein